MLPIALTMEAFGPYLNRQRVDFSRLPDRFLIWGETGAGKTALLDAMTCALYNRASGEERGRFEDLRSQLAQDARDTLIEFEFSVRGRRYRFWKRLRPVRSRKADPGPRRYNVDCGAVELLPGGEEKPLLENARPSAQEEAAQAVIGMGYDQFVQVMVLPQGRFERFLTADSRDKEGILRSIFRTDRYNAYQEHLARRCRAMESDVRAMEQALSARWAEYGAASAQELEAQLADDAAELARLDEAQERARLKYEHDNAHGQAARDLAERFARQEQAQAALNALEARREEMNAARRTLDAATRALRAAPALDAATRAQAEQERTDRACEEAERALRSAQSRREQATEQLGRAREAQEQAEGLRREAEQWERRLPELIALDGARRERAGAERALQIAQESVARLEAQRKEGAAHLAARREAGRALDALARTVPEWRRAVENYAESARRAARARELGAQWRAAQTEAERAARLHARCVEQESELTRQELERQAQYFSNAAAELAKRLEDGQPCPVCGSREHPNARFSAAYAGARQHLVEVRRRLEEARTALQQAGAAAAAAGERALGLEAQARAAQDEAARGVPYDAARAAEAQQALNQAQRAAQQMPALEAELAALEAQAAQREAELQGRREELQRCEAAAERARTRVQEAEKRAGGADGDAQRAQARLQELRRELTALEDALESAQRSDRDAEQQAALCAHRAADARVSAQAAEEGAQAAQRALAAALEARGFDSAQALRAAQRSEAEMARLQAALTEHEGRLAAARAQHEAARVQTEGQQRPDLEAVQEAAAAALRVYNETAAQAGAQRALLERKRALAESTRRSSEELVKARATCERMRDFVQCFARNAGETLSSFVLATMLGSVAERANELLELVHGGRYQLTVRTARSRQKLDGLELSVLDGYSGGERDVRTLSGGEKFLVSLALSLGLSAVVRAQAGGVAMEAMFIDEGFGSLDPRSIRDALEVLSRIGTGGKVGIISHVEALRETIAQGVEAVKGAGGSAVRMHE